MMMMLRMAEECGWQGPRVMEGPLVRDASYSRQPPRPTVPPPAAGKKLRHFGQKKKIPAPRPDQLSGYVQLNVHL